MSATPAADASELVRIGESDLEVRRIGDPHESTTLVFLHEGLGSAGLWRDFPDELCAACLANGVVYSRHGYGRSSVLEGRRTPDFMHREAEEVLPALLARLGVKRPVLVGHSDGASIALIYSGIHADVRGLIVEAPHVYVEPECIAGIASARATFERTDLRERLARYHRDPAKTFYGWHDIWTDPAFRDWNIEAYLAGIRAPVLAIQGHDDQYGTMAQIEAIAAQVAGTCELLKIDECGHTPHRDQTDQVLAAMRRFILKLPA